MRRVLVLAGAALAVLATPGTASADVIFDQADVDELVETLGEAYEAQQVCYGWQVDVDNMGSPESSVGSNFGAGQRLQDAAGADDCDTIVEFQASIRWTSESSESEDSASYQVLSLPEGPTTSDLDSLEIISEDGLAGDNVDADVYKAVSALPLLAADAGVADPIEASPAPESEAEAAGGAPTDSPGSDFWRQVGGATLFGALLLLAGGVFAFWAIKSSRGSVRRRAAAAPVEPGGPLADYVPPEWSAPKRYPTYEPEDLRPPEKRAAAEPEPTEPEPAEPEPPAAAEQTEQTEQTETPPSSTAEKPAAKPDPKPRPEE